jgi:MFS superfamily sulfate permease-like transporter
LAIIVAVTIDHSRGTESGRMFTDHGKAAIDPMARGNLLASCRGGFFRSLGSWRIIDRVGSRASAYVIVAINQMGVAALTGPAARGDRRHIAIIPFRPRIVGISLVGKIPTVLPSLTLRMPQGLTLDNLALDAPGILVVNFGSGIVTARSFGAKNRYRVNANRKLIGFGAANIACGLFGRFPVSGADSRTAINDVVGGRIQVAALVAAAALTFVLVALTDVMKYLPAAALGAITASAAIDLFDAKELRRQWQTSQAEFLFALIAMVGIIGLGVLSGVLVAMIATLVYLLARVSARATWGASAMVSISCIATPRQSLVSRSTSCRAA